MLSGEKLRRREPQTSYNGAEGVPIREEVLEQHGEEIITRNSYGARCLNTPNVLFADIDFDGVPFRWWVASVAVLVTCSVAAGCAQAPGGLASPSLSWHLCLQRPGRGAIPSPSR